MSQAYRWANLPATRQFLPAHRAHITSGTDPAYIFIPEGRCVKFFAASGKFSFAKGFESASFDNAANGGANMKKIIVLVLVVIGLLAIIPAMEVGSSTQVLSRSGFADGGM